MKINQTAALATCFILLFVLAGCHASSLKVTPAPLGKSQSMSRLLDSLPQPGPIQFEKHLAARWAVDRSGLINLDHPRAIEAGLTAGSEPIELYVYTLKHPVYGTYLVDSGVSDHFTSNLSSVVRAAMHTDSLKVIQTTRSIATEAGGRINGVFLTHIHLDHILGLQDLPSDTPVYLGAGDVSITGFENFFSQGTTDRLLGNARVLREWPSDGENPAARPIDIFGDGSVWAIPSPGHTPGSTAYLIRSTEGAQLITGDVCHTRWGWEHGVEPGTFSVDQPRSATSLERLEKLVERFPEIRVHPGHQSLGPQP